GASGVVLAEIYDATSVVTFTSTTPRLVNVSARSFVGTDADILIAGLVLGGVSPRTILIRAVGPTLASFGVTGALSDPILKLYKGNTLVESNDDWEGDDVLKEAFSQTGAFGFASDSSKDAVLLVTLSPGSYSAQIA